MITGAHAVIYSKRPDADRAFLREVLGLKGVDVGGGWIVYGLPPSEVAVHPGEKNNVHELFLLVGDIDAFVAKMKRRDVRCTKVSEQRWGRLTRVSLPGGGRLPVYEPRHERPG